MELTVVVLTYNRKAYLERALEAIFSQTYREFDLWVVDNASTDGTEELVVSKFVPLGVRYIRHEVNIGNLNNYNYVFDHCTTPYLLITHDDDEMKPEMIRLEMQALCRDPEAILVSCEMDFINEDGVVVTPAVYRTTYSVYSHSDYQQFQFIHDYVKGTNIISCPTVMLRTRYLVDTGFRFRREAGPSADSMLWMELNTLPGRFLYLKDSLYRYRLHNGQDSYLQGLKGLVDIYKPVDALLASMNAFRERKIWRNRSRAVIKNYVLSALKGRAFSRSRRYSILPKIGLSLGAGFAIWLFGCKCSPNFLLLVNRISRILIRQRTRIGKVI